MATQENTKPSHNEHPHSRFVDKDDPSHTLFNVGNSLSLIKQLGLAELEGVSVEGAQVILDECISAVYFEAARMGERL